MANVIKKHDNGKCYKCRQKTNLKVGSFDPIHPEGQFLCAECYKKLFSIIDLDEFPQIEDKCMYDKNEHRKRVLIDLLTTWDTLGPIVGGCSAVLLAILIESWALGGLGFLAGLAGLGLFATKVIFRLDTIVAEIGNRMLDQEKQKRDQTLDALTKRLKEDRDPRPEKCLKILRFLKDNLRSTGEKPILHGAIAADFENLFSVCIKQIEKTDELWRKSRQSTPTIAKKLKAEREKIVLEVVGITQKLENDFVSNFDTQTEQNELNSLQEELDRSLRIAKATDKRLSELYGENVSGEKE